MAFIWERPVPEAWRRRLAQCAGGRSDRVHWPFLAWIPGEPWQPVQRWGVFSVIPGPVLFGDELVLPALEGEHPRARWAWRSDLGRMAPLTPEDLAGCTKQEWELFRELGGWARLEWVIQGRHGGHKRRFSPKEEWLLAKNGRLGTGLPNPGDLPYAPFDERVVRALAEVDALRHKADRVRQLAEEGAGARADVQGRKDTAQRDLRESLLGWMDRQIEQAVEEADVKRWNMSDLPYNRTADVTGDLSAATEQFLSAR